MNPRQDCPPSEVPGRFVRARAGIDVALADLGDVEGEEAAEARDLLLRAFAALGRRANGGA